MQSAVRSSTPEVSLKRQIGLYAATSITIGNIVGSGIFRSPHSVAQELPTLPLVLMAWTLGGVLSLCGSLALAELAAAHPKTGGLYVFIREGFGDAFAFVFGWANLWVIKPTVIASIASVFATYFCDALGLAANAQFAAGVAAIALLTFINWLGVKQGAGTQSVFTTAKMIGIAGLCAAAFLLPHTTPAAASLPAAPVFAHPMFIALVLAMIPILFAYDGWTDSTYVGGEIINPRRTLPIAIVGGTIVVIVAYLITNAAYYKVLTPGEVAHYEAVGSEAIRRIWGAWGGRALAVLVAVSTFGTINGAILTGPRVTQAMAADGLLFERAARIDPKRGTPTFALWLQGILSAIWLYFASGFEDVSGWFVTTSWLFYALTIAALFVHRARERAGRAPESAYRTPLFPITPILFVLVTFVLIASDLQSSGWRAMAGVAVALLGFPVYLAWKGGRRRRTA
jgi:amino acid transporter